MNKKFVSSLLTLQLSYSNIEQTDIMIKFLFISFILCTNDSQNLFGLADM